ncbi:SYF2 splicing factor-domain-containing protein [Radiomyces spectabilis]|uniref:SYF2 splicing factor-domain-containing protein n=1 Tax=Radiomyces spectabilis TaxID=64574 RepID=UPI00221E955A|nr:SYF2 splicing factor-domain-containing protein [Radiomyces spectabilis]KAI8387980.1 SYF2 splicing factor-domain-containing protein [Radiomyces spectabilis]
MPPKRKTRGAAAKQKEETEERDVVEETNTEVEQPKEKRRRTSVTSDPSRDTDPVEKSTTDDPQDNTDKASPASTQESEAKASSTLEARMAKLKELKRRRATEVEQGNRRDRNLEFQRSKENPRAEARNERKKQEALKLLEKQQAQDQGEDYERKQFWKYSAESVDAWEKRMAKKAQRANQGFTDHVQAAHKKYLKLISELKPDMTAYAEKKMESIERAIQNGEDPSDIMAIVNSLDYASMDDRPSQEAIDRLAAETKKQIQRRETRSRDRKEATDDISWINEKNRVFNQKIARFYDKYTKEIRENLERGTAL